MKTVLAGRDRGSIDLIEVFQMGVKKRIVTDQVDGPRHPLGKDMDFMDGIGSERGAPGTGGVQAVVDIGGGFRFAQGVHFTCGRNGLDECFARGARKPLVELVLSNQ